MFFEVGVLQKLCNMKTPALESLFDKTAGLKVWNFTKKRFQHRCLHVNIATAFFVEHLRWLLMLIWYGNCYWGSIGHLFLIKNTMSDGSPEYVLYIPVETIPRRFCWLTCRKQKLAQRKTLQQGLFVLISGFRQI